MQQHPMPHAPPPPPPIMRQAFPGMPGLVNDFGRVHLDPHGHHNAHNMHQPAIQVIQPPGHGHMPDPLPFSSSSKPPIGYVGYIFTKNPVEHVGQKETWAIAYKDSMPASQADLRSQVEKNRKRGVTGLDQYMDADMKGFKRKQIDELIQECVKMDPDQRFEYTIASIKRDIRRRRSGPETSTMQVILKRQPRAGIDMRGPFVGFGNIRLPSSGLVDLSGAEDYERSSQASSNGHRPGMHPFERHLSEPWVHSGHAERPQIHPVHSDQNAHPHDLHNPHAHDEAGKKMAHGQEQIHHPLHDHPAFGAEVKNHKHDHEGDGKKHKNKGHKTPEIIIVKKDVHNSHDEHSDFSSSSDGESSSDDTDRTPDTIISSEDSRSHHKDKKYRNKDKHHRKSSSHDHEHEPSKKIYREHKRKEPLRRLSSPPPSHRSPYRHEDVYLVPGHISHRRQEPLHPRERLPVHHRAMSYDDDRLHDHDLRGLGRRPTVYRRRITSTAHPVDVFEERAERRRNDLLDREIWEREEAARMRETARRDARERIDAERMYHPHSRTRTDRLHGYHDDHFRGYYDERY